MHRPHSLFLPYCSVPGLASESSRERAVNQWEIDVYAGLYKMRCYQPARLASFETSLDLCQNSRPVPSAHPRRKMQAVRAS